ncbi:MAG: hypothetical protein Q8S75_09010 [Nitrospirota bacterium]|jgi:hypothetical protein|nr:hypothetical protein [Nitrospirota bacterium]
MARATLSTQIWHHVEQILALTTAPTFATLPLAVRRQLATDLAGINIKLSRQIAQTHSRLRTPSPRDYHHS